LTLPVETLKSVPRGKAVWNANGGFVSVLLTHLFIFYFILPREAIYTYILYIYTWRLNSLLVSAIPHSAN